MNLTYIANSLIETEKFAQEITHKLIGKTIFLNGNLGAGKTTFVKYIVSNLGESEQASSPTFTLMQEYITSQSKVLHFDLYRLNSIYELENIGFYEEIEQEATIFIEWADKFDLKNEINDYVEINIDITGDGSRSFVVKGIE